MKPITYKEREGLIIRFVTWALASLFALFGCVSLFYAISPEDITKVPPQKTFWGYTVQQLMGSDAPYTIPFFELNITVGTIISALAFAIIVILINRFVVNTSKSADFLIETEFELKKVSWPPRNEYWGSSVAVIISVVVIGLFIFIVDMILTQIMKLVYLQ
ncbi:MAG: preprotein translocase subunit SecE [Planctomycetota bacterium]